MIEVNDSTNLEAAAKFNAVNWAEKAGLTNLGNKKIDSIPQ